MRRTKKAHFISRTKFGIKLLAVCGRARARKIQKYGLIWVNSFPQLVDKQIVKMQKKKMCIIRMISSTTKIQFNRALML